MSTGICHALVNEKLLIFHVMQIAINLSKLNGLFLYFLFKTLTLPVLNKTVIN